MGSQARKRRSSATPRLEWLLGIFGILLLASIVSLLVYEGLTHGDEPGAVVVTVTGIRDVGNVHLVKFSVRNEGSETLNQLHLTARLTDGNRQIESAQALIDYLPARSEQEGGVYLRNDPHRYALQIDPAGYMKP
jgi:uncharacterized protein (TIGR02588 family)